LFSPTNPVQSQIAAAIAPATAAPLPFLITCCACGSTATNCATGEHMTISEMRRRFPADRSQERWVLLSGAAPIEDRLCDGNDGLAGRGSWGRRHA